MKAELAGMKVVVEAAASRYRMELERRMRRQAEQTSKTKWNEEMAAID